MKRTIALTGLAACLLTIDRPAGAQTTVAEAERAFQSDVHAAAGLTCASCHASGTRPTGPPREGAGPKRTEIATLCAKCHADATYMRKYDPQVRIDQYAQYVTSPHGKRMAQGDDRAATCSDCHSAHGITRVADARSPVAPLNAARTCARCHADQGRMAAFGRDAAPFADWSASVHAVALLTRGDTSAPTCNTCHGSHGATPPGVTEVANVCAQCHVREAELFRASPKKVAFDAMGQSECLACHSNHRIQPPADGWIGLGEGAVCATCHDAAMPGAKTIAELRTGLERLTDGFANADAVLDRADRAGMLVDEGHAALRAAREHQVHARVMVHAFASKPFADMVAAGVSAAQRGQSVGEDALRELQVRRRGLGVATVLILGFLATLGWKIRQLDSR